MSNVSEPNWLDPQEQRSWRSIIALVRHLQREVNAPLQSETGLSEIDYSVLVYLSESSNHEARMTELGQNAGASSSQLAYRIDRLVKLGLIERRDCPTDRRGSNAALTAEGLATLHRAAALHVECVRRVFVDKLTRSEFVELGRLLDKGMAATTVQEPAGGLPT